MVIPLRRPGCQVHKHRDLVPLDQHHIWPLAEGGPDVQSNLVTVCPNAHRRIHDYLRLLKKHDGAVPWAKRQLFGRTVRAYAGLGYAAMKDKDTDT